MDKIKEVNVEKIKSDLPNEHLTTKLAEFFSVFGDSTRMQMIALLRRGKMNVTDIASALDLSVSAVSHQLKLLKTHDLVRSERKGKYIYYYLSDEHVTSIFDQGINHLTEKR